MFNKNTNQILAKKSNITIFRPCFKQETKAKKEKLYISARLYQDGSKSEKADILQIKNNLKKKT